MNEQNLKPAAHALTVEEQSKGGIASGAARRRKRNLKLIAEMLSDYTIDMPMPHGATEEMTYDVAMVQRMYQKAITEGDVQAAKYIAELLGDLKQNVEVSAPILNITTTERGATALKKLVDAANGHGC